MKPLSDQHMQMQRRLIDQRLMNAAERSAFKRLDLVAVCMVGTKDRIPFSLGDTEGAWTVSVRTTRKPDALCKDVDLNQPLHPTHILGLVWCRTEAHALRLKAALDKQLLIEDVIIDDGHNFGHNGGPPLDSVNPRRLRYGWRKLENEPEFAWQFLLQDALNDIRERESFDVIDDDERARLISQEKASPRPSR